MKVSNPSITWSNRTTLVTGVPPSKHGVVLNGRVVRDGPRSPVSVEEWRDKAELVRVPKVYDLAHEVGLVTAEVDWPATSKAGTIKLDFSGKSESQRCHRTGNGC